MPVGFKQVDHFEDEIWGKLSSNVRPFCSRTSRFRAMEIITILWLGKLELPQAPLGPSHPWRSTCIELQRTTIVCMILCLLGDQFATPSKPGVWSGTTAARGSLIQHDSPAGSSNRHKLSISLKRPRAVFRVPAVIYLARLKLPRPSAVLPLRVL